MRRAVRILLIALVASLAATFVVARLASQQAPLGESATSEPARRGGEDRENAFDWSGIDGHRVLVLGGRFASDWFRHWGAMSHKEPVQRDGLTLVLGDVERPPGGAKAAKEYLSEAPEGLVVFFMLGPEALEGGSKERARQSVDRALAQVDVYAGLTHEAGCRLVVGGPLPSLPNDTDRHLVGAQEAYRDALRERHRAGRLVVFDAYEHMSTAGQVTLVRGYAFTQADSRLGGAGYQALDEIFFPFMRRQF